MSSPDREIPQRELRNKISQVLREVEAGARLRVTVGGRPVAELTPIVEQARLVTRRDIQRILREAPLDADFLSDVDAVCGGTIEEL